MIRIDDVTYDAQGLPIVRWEEDRNIFAPEGAGRSKVVCFIRPNAEGELMFVSVGSVRHGEHEEARPWRLLQSFSISRADEHYYEPLARAAMDALLSKNRMLHAGMTDGAQVVLAHFADEQASVPMHLNCASTSPVEVARLHDRLRREFIDKRLDLVVEKCDSEFVWKGKFEAYKPAKEQQAPRQNEHVMNFIVYAVLSLIVVAIVIFVAG